MARATTETNAADRRTCTGRLASVRRFFGTPEGRWFAALLVVATALRLALIPTTAHLTDVFTDEFTFKRHVVLIHERGLLASFRDTNTSYVAYQYALWLLSLPYGWLGGAFDTSAGSLRALVKLPPLALDVALICATYVAARDLASEMGSSSGRRWLPLGVAALVAFHPVVVYDSAVWAQIDAAVALSAVLAIWCAARGQPVGAAAALAFGLLSKPQPVIFVPVVAVLVWRTTGASGIARALVAGVVVSIVPLLPWLMTGDAARIVQVYRKLFSNNNNVTALTQNAWNLWWFIPFEKVPQAKDVMATVGGLEVTYQRFSLALSGLAALLAGAYTWRRPTAVGGLLAAGYIAAAFYVLPTSTHERYMYPLVAVLAPVLLSDARVRWVYVLFSATLFVNMFLVAPPIASWQGRWDDALFTHYVAGLNVLVFGIFTWVVASDLVSGHEAGRRATSSAPASAADSV